MNRRNFIKTSAATIVANALTSLNSPASNSPTAPLFEISLAEWSLHRTIWKKQLTNLDFPKYAKDQFGITAVEYVNVFFKDKALDNKYLTELKKRTSDESIKNLLIMVDAEGHIGAKNLKQRQQAVDNHKKWVEAAKSLGCHSIRVNAHTSGKDRHEKTLNTIDGLTKLSEFAKPLNINIIVENHGGLSSDGAWLANVLKTVNLPNCGSLPDFGNFYKYDRYQGISDLMPFAKGVSAKSNAFDDKGNEKYTDFYKAMKICLDAGYRGHVGIEWAGNKISEPEGILKTKALLEKIRKSMTKTN